MKRKVLIEILMIVSSVLAYNNVISASGSQIPNNITPTIPKNTDPHSLNTPAQNENELNSGTQDDSNVNNNDPEYDSGTIEDPETKHDSLHNE